jgi:organic radical activating enzyme
MAERFTVRSVEYPVADHCNLSCANCDHASPLLPPKLADVGQFQRDLDRLGRVLQVGEFRIMGGEPLLHPELLTLLTIARASRIAQRITLVTNGVLLHTVPAALWGMIDCLWLSLYPKVTVRVDLDEVARQCEAHGVQLDRRDIDTFRRSLLNRPIEDPAIVKDIYDRCLIAHKWRCYTVHDGRFYKCSPAPFMEGRLRLRGVSFNSAADGVPIDDDPALSERLLAYLSDDRPLAACAYCLGTSGAAQPHRQLNRRAVQDAIRGDDEPFEALINHDDLTRDPAAIRQPMFWYHASHR